MLGRNSFTSEEVDRATAVLHRQLQTWRALQKAVAATGDAKAEQARRAFEPVFCDNLLLALDRPFVHRIRKVTGKDGNPLNEVELLSECLMRDGVLRESTVIKLQPDDSVSGIAYGEKIELSTAQFDQLAKAFFAELGSRFC